MDGTQFIVGVAASISGRGAGNAYWEGFLQGVELVMDKLADEGVPSDEWVAEVRDFLSLAQEHPS